MSPSIPRSSSGRKTWRPPPDCVIMAAQTRNSPACPTASVRVGGQCARSGTGHKRSDRALVIDTLHEPVVASDVVIELAQEVAVEHDLPVLADHGFGPPRRLDLPAGDGVDRAVEHTGD